MKFLVLQHIECEHPGIFRDLMQADGVSYDAVELDHGEVIPKPVGYDALMVMGGPMDVWEVKDNPWLKAEIDFIGQWVREGKPYIGFCLGHQLLAAALGGKVGPAVHPEIGVLPVNLTAEGRDHWLFAGCPASFLTLQWHSAEVTNIPKGAIVLADTAECSVNALAFGEVAVSVQFHVELTDTTVAEWGEIPAYRDALENALGQGAMKAMQSDSDSNMDNFQRLSATLYRNFAEQVHNHRQTHRDG